MNYHIPVLLNEVIEGLKIRPGGRYIDATVGDGGHTGEILKRGGTVLGIDRDEEAIERTKKRFETEIKEGRLILMRSNFDKLVSSVALWADPLGGDSGTFFSGDARLRESNPDAGRLKPRSLKVRPIPGFGSSSSLDVTGSLFPGKKAPSSPSVLVISKMTSSGQPVDTLPPDRREGKFANFANFDGILFDLGMSSGQIEGSGRGFSFQRDEPLDMRMDGDLGVTAADLVNGLGKKELVSLFLRLGQVERAGAIAEEIVRRRREGAIKTTKELADVIEKVLPRRGRLHPATKVFMALRMAVNDELGSLERALPQAVQLLIPGGRLAVISFHEGEDRIVKRFFRSGSNQVGVLSRSTPLRRPPPRIVFSLGVRALERGPFASHPSCFFEVNKKPIVATEEEIEMNPRARSAKLRIGERGEED